MMFLLVVDFGIREIFVLVILSLADSISASVSTELVQSHELFAPPNDM